MASTQEGGIANAFLAMLAKVQSCNDQLSKAHHKKMGFQFKYLEKKMEVAKIQLPKTNITINPNP
jgi:hypothetical protein